MHSNVLFVYGTRPEAVKLAPVVEAVSRIEGLSARICVTGQHREMLDQVNDLFGLKPDSDLDIMRQGQTLSGVLASAVSGLEPVIQDMVPSVVVVQGDTLTAFAGGLAAFYCRVPVAHVEAGLRTGLRKSPFPEDLNRRLLGQIADLHLAPTPRNRENLIREGVSPGDIVVTGNTVIDALRFVLGAELPISSSELRSCESDRRRVLLVTTHRRESWGEPMARVLSAVAVLADRHRDMLVIFPVHRNPVVHDLAHSLLGQKKNVILTEPLDYRDFAWCLDRSHVVLTDSGGVQEEAPSLGKPVLVAREDTERPEAVEAGVARLVGTETTRIVQEVERLWTDENSYAAMSRAVNPYGDGRAAERCASAIRYLVAGDRMTVR